MNSICRFLVIRFANIHFLFRVLKNLTNITLIQKHSLEMLAFNVVPHIGFLGMFENRAQGAVEVSSVG